MKWLRDAQVGGPIAMELAEGKVGYGAAIQQHSVLMDVAQRGTEVYMTLAALPWHEPMGISPPTEPS